MKSPSNIVLIVSDDMGYSDLQYPERVEQLVIEFEEWQKPMPPKQRPGNTDPQ